MTNYIVAILKHAGQNSFYFHVNLCALFRFCGLIVLGLLRFWPRTVCKHQDTTTPCHQKGFSARILAVVGIGRYLRGGAVPVLVRTFFPAIFQDVPLRGGIWRIVLGVIRGGFVGFARYLVLLDPPFVTYALFIKNGSRLPPPFPCPYPIFGLCVSPR